MATRRLLMALLPTLPFLLLIPVRTNAGSEGFMDLYLGAAGDRKADVGVSETTSSGTTSAAASVDLHTSTEFGIRFGAWHPTYDWFGLGIDLGYSHADGPGVDIKAFPMTILLALRAPLFPTPDRPGGRLQPYAMAGMSFYITDVSVKLDGMGGSSSQVSWPWPYIGNPSGKVYGPYLAAGLAWQPAKRFAFFGEYRHTSFDVGYDTTNSWIYPTMNGRVDATFRADRILFGISHRFGAGTPVKEASR